MSPKRHASTCMDSQRPRANRTMLSAGRLLWCAARVVFVCVGAAQLVATADAQTGPTAAPLPAVGAPGPQAGTAPTHLLEVKRICVARLNGEERFAAQVQDMLISSLFTTKHFAVTDNCERADAVFKGTAAENKERLSRLEDEGIGFGKSVGAASGSWNRSGGSVSGGSAGVAGLAGETLASASEKTNATVALRLVTKDGDVLWATTEESTGNRIKGPAADLADRAVRSLMRELEKASTPAAPKSPHQ
jgi:hypothetical protein